MSDVKKHKHSLYDTDPHFKIDPITRNITTESKKVTLMQYDHNAERYTFELPREIEGHDMLQCDRVEVHWINTGSNKTEWNADVYEVDDFQVSPESEDIAICSWLISGNSTQFAGSLNFVLVFKCTDGDETTYRWATNINNMTTIKSGIDNGETVVEQYSDILQQWYDELFSVKDENEETDTKYFDVDYDGLLSLRPEYRGDSSESDYVYSISDNGVGKEGSKINELPENIVIPEIIGTTAVVGFKDGAFLSNKRVKSITIPKSVTTLPIRFARKAYNLQSVKNTEQIEHLNNVAFAYSGLRKAIFPNLKTLGSNVFSNCSNLVIVDLGNNITEIPDTTFAQISNISCVLGGAKITKVGERAFAFNRRLKNLPFLSNLKNIGQEAFFDCRVDFENAYPTLTANGCTFGTNATYKQINGTTDYWTGVEYTPCENPLRSLFHQKDPRWATDYVGTTEFNYADNGCAMITMSEIYSAFENVNLQSPKEFVEILESKNIDYSNYRYDSGQVEILEALGYDVEFVEGMSSANLKKMYDALKEGALIKKSHMIYGQPSSGHAILVYGINGIGEILISDSATHCHGIGLYKNHLSSMPIYTTGDSGMDFIIVKKPV